MEYRGGELELEPIFQEGRFVTPSDALRLLSHENDRGIVQQAIAEASRRVGER
jgi:hypothetical protein